MYLEVDASGVTLREPDVFAAFKVLVHPNVVDLARSLDGVAVVDDDGDINVAVSVLRKLSGRQDDAGWNAQFEAMLQYADKAGWLSQDGARVQAHCETLDD